MPIKLPPRPLKNPYLDYLRDLWTVEQNVRDNAIYEVIEALKYGNEEAKARRRIGRKIAMNANSMFDSFLNYNQQNHEPRNPHCTSRRNRTLDTASNR